MIRFINLTGQGAFADGDICFAWYNTITDTFMNFNGVEAWGTWDEFTEDFKHSLGEDLARYAGLFPKVWQSKAPDSIPGPVYWSQNPLPESFPSFIAIDPASPHTPRPERDEMLDALRYAYYPVPKSPPILIRLWRLIQRLTTWLKNLTTLPQRLMAHYLKRRGWVAFYLDPIHRKCGNGVCWMACYATEEKDAHGDKACPPN